MLRSAITNAGFRAFSTTALSRNKLLVVDPPYLKLLKPPLPVYEDPINIQLKGYDFAVLEQQSRKIQKIVGLLDMKISEVWATPLEAVEVETFKPHSTATDKTYRLNIYERNVQISQLRASSFGLLVDLIRKNLAAGVTISIHKHLPEHEEIRHIPDLELESLEKQLQELLSARNKS